MTILFDTDISKLVDEGLNSQVKVTALVFVSSSCLALVNFCSPVAESENKCLPLCPRNKKGIGHIKGP